jgi:hypothetical protein
VAFDEEHPCDACRRFYRLLALYFEKQPPAGDRHADGRGTFEVERRAPGRLRASHDAFLLASRRRALNWRGHDACARARYRGCATPTAKRAPTTATS